MKRAGCVDGGDHCTTLWKDILALIVHANGEGNTFYVICILPPQKNWRNKTKVECMFIGISRKQREKGMGAYTPIWQEWFPLGLGWGRDPAWGDGQIDLERCWSCHTEACFLPCSPLPPGSVLNPVPHEHIWLAASKPHPEAYYKEDWQMSTVASNLPGLW